MECFFFLSYRSVVLFGLDFAQRPSHVSLDHWHFDDCWQRFSSGWPQSGQNGKQNFGNVC